MKLPCSWTVEAEQTIRPAYGAQKHFLQQIVALRPPCAHDGAGGGATRFRGRSGRRLGRAQSAFAATAPLILDRRAGHGTVGAEHAAVARLGLEQRVAAFALVEPLAGVGGHGFGLDVAAQRAGQG